MPSLANPKHEAVLRAYLADATRVGWRAYKRIYPKSSQRAAETAWSRLMKDAEFSARAAELDGKVTEKAIEKSGITVEMVITELGKIGFANMQDYMTVGADGQPLLDWGKLSRDQAAALAQVEVESLSVGGDEEKGVTGDLVRKVKFKLHDKRAALVSIGEHLGAFKRKIEHSGPNGGAIPIKNEEPEFTDLEVARRIAFLLEKGARAKAQMPSEKPARPRKKARG